MNENNGNLLMVTYLPPRARKNTSVKTFIGYSEASVLHKARTWLKGKCWKIVSLKTCQCKVIDETGNGFQADCYELMNMKKIDIQQLKAN